MQMNPVIRSRRKALREAHAWLMARALEMNDPQARDILNSAAFAFGQEKLRGFDPRTGRSALQELDAAKRSLRSSELPARSPSGEHQD